MSDEPDGMLLEQEERAVVASPPSALPVPRTDIMFQQCGSVDGRARVVKLLRLVMRADMGGGSWNEVKL